LLRRCALSTYLILLSAWCLELSILLSVYGLDQFSAAFGLVSLALLLCSRPFALSSPMLLSAWCFEQIPDAFGLETSLLSAWPICAIVCACCMFLALRLGEYEAFGLVS
jgi:hypothetical protein